MKVHKNWLPGFQDKERVDITKSFERIKREGWIVVVGKEVEKSEKHSKTKGNIWTENESKEWYTRKKETDRHKDRDSDINREKR